MARPQWVTWSAYTGVTVVGGTTIVMSGMWLTQLAELVGIPWPMSLSHPIAVDAGGAVATVLWVTHTGAVEKWARGVAIGALAYSLTGNAVSHLIRLDMLPVTWPLVVAVSGVYPLMCWLMVHLLVLARTGAKRSPAKPKPAVQVKKADTPPTPPPPLEPKPQPEPEPAPANVVPIQALDKPAVTKKEAGRARFHELVAQGRDPATITAAEIDRHIDAKGYAKQLIPGWREEARPKTTTARSIP